ncbi:MAG: hypothetical protein CMF38_01635 [Legionellaceae bacterium]|nr:hypothetical protein [Legionellaceae bacterium]HCA89746.1 hypothetical protein [Legionellales bacterium]|tara:strand:- start:1066 stop:1443 length:378 start_codon:yes stop_codon:yes gene_type:complete
MNINKKFNMLLLGTSVLLASNVYAEQTMSPRGYDLKPHVRKVIKGDFTSTRQLTCKVRATDNQAPMSISLSAIKKRVILDKQIIPQGQGVVLNVKVGDKFTVELEKRGRVSLTNESEELINLDCN